MVKGKESRFVYLSIGGCERLVMIHLRGVATPLVMSCWCALAHLWTFVVY